MNCERGIEEGAQLGSRMNIEERPISISFSPESKDSMPKRHEN
jgi:hypothetical protein